MELPRRGRDDVYLPDGAFRKRVAALREVADAHDLAIGIIYAFDFRTRMLPFWYADKRMAPLVQQTCREFGLRYAVNQTVRAAVASHFRWLRRMGQPQTASDAPAKSSDSSSMERHSSACT